MPDIQKMGDCAGQIRHTRFMQSGAIRKWLLALTLLAVILWTTVHFYNLSMQNSGNGTRIIFEPQDDFSYHQTNLAAAKPQKANPSADAQKSPRQKVEEWLALHRRDVTSLLAAFHVLNDTNYLKEAATNFPDDPRVEWTVLVHNVFPDDRRKWLNLFKASSPSNSLANYLSAQAYFQNGQSGAAVKDLVAASSKPEFENYTLASQLDTEELAVYVGKSALDSTEAGVASFVGDTLPELATLKQLASQMANLQKQELTVGDNDSAENLAQLGTILGGQLNSGESGRYLLNQLTGIAIESKTLEQLDPNTSYDFLDGETPGQRLQELGEQQAALDQLQNRINAIQPSLTGAERVSFQERVKIYGELAAMQWLLQQHASLQNGQ